MCVVYYTWYDLTENRKFSSLNQTSNLYIMYFFLQAEKFYGNDEHSQCNKVTDMANRWSEPILNYIVYKMKCQRCKIHRKITISNIALFYCP